MIMTSETEIKYISCQENMDKKFNNFMVMVRTLLFNLKFEHDGLYRIEKIDQLFKYMERTKHIWRYNIKTQQKLTTILLRKIIEFRKNTNVAHKEAVAVMLENMEHRLELFCSMSKKSGGLCKNKSTHLPMKMCTLHKNKEKKIMTYVQETLDNENFPKDISKIVGMYIYIE
jgi:hypothetical protein